MLVIAFMSKTSADFTSGCYDMVCCLPICFGHGTSVRVFLREIHRAGKHSRTGYRWGKCTGVRLIEKNHRTHLDRHAAFRYLRRRS